MGPLRPDGAGPCSPRAPRLCGRAPRRRRSGGEQPRVPTLSRARGARPGRSSGFVPAPRAGRAAGGGSRRLGSRRARLGPRCRSWLQDAPLRAGGAPAWSLTLRWGRSARPGTPRAALTPTAAAPAPPRTPTPGGMQPRAKLGGYGADVDPALFPLFPRAGRLPSVRPTTPGTLRFAESQCLAANCGFCGKPRQSLRAPLWSVICQRLKSFHEALRSLCTEAVTVSRASSWVSFVRG